MAGGMDDQHFAPVSDDVRSQEFPLVQQIRNDKTTPQERARVFSDAYFQKYPAEKHDYSSCRTELLCLSSGIDG